MAAKSNLKNMVLCLFGTCLFCSAILGAVYTLTEEPISVTNKRINEEAVGKVLFRNADNTGLKEGTAIKDVEHPDTLLLDGKTYLCYAQVNTADSTVVAYAVKSTVTGFGGPLTLMVGITSDKAMVINTAVIAHQETPGLGAKCTSDEKFTGQWKNLDLATHKLQVQKPVKDGIDAITASTITSKAYTLAVANALEALSTVDVSSDPTVIPTDSTVIPTEVEESQPINEKEVSNE